MRSLFLLTAAVIVLLAIDAAEFSGQYRKAVWHEMSYLGRTLQYKVDRALDPALF
jgi:hypothetical protein